MSEETVRITIGDFMKMDLRVGKILSCEKLPKSRKLLRMDVDLGAETRQILAGLAPYYLPEEMVGRRVVVVANLEPAKLMGVESQGMVLATDSGPDSASPSLVAVPDGVPLGSRVR